MIGPEITSNGISACELTNRVARVMQQGEISVGRPEERVVLGHVGGDRAGILRLLAEAAARSTSKLSKYTHKSQATADCL